MSIIGVASVAIFITLSVLFLRWSSKRNISFKTIRGSSDVDQILRLRGSKDRHGVSTALANLLEHDGAGTWPPKCNHDTWPEALKPYKKTYLDLVATLPAAVPSLDDSVNSERINRYRASVKKLLADRVDIAEVARIMRRVEAGDYSELPRDEINGFYCAVAVFRHAYRWATIPVVKIAQLEKEVDLPPELEAPWTYLQRYFDFEADSGNLTSNILHNFNEQGERVYKVNVGLSNLITSSEDAFSRMFYDMEVMAKPIYCDMVNAILSFEDGDRVRSLRHLERVTVNLREMLGIFYEKLSERHISHKAWLSYVQGFQAWGVGRVIDGEYVKFDGLSGNHVLVFQALDAFLGMKPFLSDDVSSKYIPGNQRRLSTSLRDSGFRDKVNAAGDESLKAEMSKIANHLRVFRAAHRARVMSYLEEPAPERFPMTAGKSVLAYESDSKTLKQAIAPLDELLASRLRDTV